MPKNENKKIIIMYCKNLFCGQTKIYKLLKDILSSQKKYNSNVSQKEQCETETFFAKKRKKSFGATKTL